ncbi:hypothetical protein [Prosthecobacter sp.]|uniref:hypothetical protein n=1 Tax=Prosthecobacter sp. TaxID=1965333 RepID=UPI003783641E
MSEMKPWEMSFNGYFWYDMPGGDELEKKCTFALYRRGMVEMEEERRCAEMAEDGITEIRNDETPRKRRLVSVAQRRYGKIGMRKVWTPKEIEARNAEQKAARADAQKRKTGFSAEDEIWLAKLKLSLGQAREVHFRALPTLAKDAEVSYQLLRRTIKGERALGLASLKRVEISLTKFLAGELTPPERNKYRPAGYTVQAPEGCMPFSAWLEMEAPKRNVKPHSLREWLREHPEDGPPIVKFNSRRWFVKVGTEVAA